MPVPGANGNRRAPSQRLNVAAAAAVRGGVSPARRSGGRHDHNHSDELSGNARGGSRGGRARQPAHSSG